MPSAGFTYRGALLHWRYEKGQLHYTVTDTIGRIQELLTEDGTIVWRGQQQLWGREESRNKEDVPTCQLRFPGQYEDAESGLYYNRFRYYDCEIGQYLCADPIGLAGGANPYGYVPNTLILDDPFGLAFGSGKGRHTASATLYDSKGNVKATCIWQSGNMTPSEKALGFPKSSLATHTEARITFDLKDIAAPGDLLEILGEYAPCKSCKGKMNDFKENTGADVIYTWIEDGLTNSWSAGR